jgi:iron complex outermembrane receptor protein
VSASPSRPGPSGRAVHPAVSSVVPVLLGVLVALAPLGAAGEPASPADTVATGAPRVTAASDSTAAFRLEPVRVTADPMPPGVVRLEERATGAVSVAEALTSVPGISLVRRSAGSAEPVIRGLGWERVATRVGGVCVSGACPSRMDPPASYFAPRMAGEVSVVKGVPSVALGPGGLGGSLEIEPDYERPPASARELHARWDEHWDSARDGLRSGGAVWGGTPRVDFRLSGDGFRFRGYETATGREVPADQDALRGAASVGWRPRDGHRVWAAWNGSLEEDVDFPSLPMDAEESELHLVNAGYRFDGRGLVERFELRGGFSTVDHFMSNAWKPNRARLEASTPSEASTGAAEARWTLRRREGATWTTGLQTTWLARDAVRTRFLPATGLTFRDHLWPETSQSTIGAYVETDRTLGSRTRLRLGGRLDVVDSRADAADDPGLGGATIREGYVAYHGPDAADTDRTETTGSLTALLRRTLPGGLGAHLGLGFSMRPAGVTERYFAYGPAPGGFQVGNPDLDPEKKWAVEVGVGRRSERLTARGTIFWHRVADFVWNGTIDRRDVNGDGIPDGIRSFRNVDADLAGFEAGFDLRPGRRWEIPVSLEFVRGWNRTDERDLPEIPPLEGTAAVRLAVDPGRPATLELAGRFALRQPFVDPEFPEDETPAWGTLAVRGEIDLPARVRLRAAVENLLDAEYHEHLTREALLPVGDLAAGDEIPSPGRSVELSLSAGF